MYFFLEETIYFRNTVEGVDDGDSAGNSVAPQTDDIFSQNKEVDNEPKIVEEPTTISSGTTSSQKSYWQRLALFRSVPGRPSIKQMFKMMYRPLLMMYHFPSVTWAGLLYGTCLSWYNVLNATTSSLLSASPYFFSSGLVGTAYTAPLIGAALAGLWSGWVTDKFAIRLARRNNGIREPEHRLWALSLSGLLCAAGLILWGVGAANDLSWVGLVFGLGMLAFSVIAGGSITLSYAVDCFKEISGETMMSVVVIRNTTGFAISYAINPWIDAMGVQNCFITAAMIALGCTATFLPMIYYGKSIRKASAKKYWEYVATAATTHA
ncbi:putative MFS-type transporter [Lachnellula subtilissima]|uniref:Putative MFS-type transporter n=1 Tax=Lachnellula subtilissima TaxID=602034 RepID=A0A8H8RLE6_9HELO|nr:putative MFS-type transporter [Lachnellula subtilissima]